MNGKIRSALTRLLILRPYHQEKIFRRATPTQQEAYCVLCFFLPCFFACFFAFACVAGLAAVVAGAAVTAAGAAGRVGGRRIGSTSASKADGARVKTRRTKNDFMMRLN